MLLSGVGVYRGVIVRRRKALMRTGRRQPVQHRPFNPGADQGKCLRVIAVHPIPFRPRHQRHINQPPVQWHPGERLEIQHLAGIATGQGGGLAHHDQVFNADTKRPLAVIAGLVGQDHAGFKRHFAGA